MDGNYSGTLAQRVASCDTIVLLDLPRRTCVWRVVRRALRYHGRTRPDMASGCPERLDASFLAWVWNYGRRTRPKVEGVLAEYAAGKTVVRLRSQADVDRFLALRGQETPN